MGDFGEGISQENNMLGEMQSYNQAVRDHLTKRNEQLNEVIRNAKGERQAVGSVSNLGQASTQFGQVGAKFADAKGVLHGTYGGNMGEYARNLGRTGKETTFGLRPAGKAAGKALGTLADVAPTGSYVKPGTAPFTSRVDIQPKGPMTAAGEAAEAGRTAPTKVVELGSGSEPSGEAEASRQVGQPKVPEGEPYDIKPKGSLVAGAGDEAKAAAGLEDTSKLGRVAGAAGDLVGAAGVGLGILGGAESLASDVSSGHFHLQGDNDAEKVGNALSMAGGALDTLGLAAPPLAILGGIVGLGSFIAEGIGHLEHSSKKAGTAKKDKDKPDETPEQVSSLASLGQVASASTDTLHTIAGTGAF